ncbi:hypothetical protein AADZ91_05240 [Colwelliaceae bacterium 6441]
MTLSDEQLLQITDNNHKVSSCSKTNKRFEHLSEIRAQLTNEVMQETTDFNIEATWEILKEEYQNNENSLIRKTTKNQSTTTLFWSYSRVAIAASLITIAIFYAYIIAPINQKVISQDSLLISLIEENNELQRQILTVFAINDIKLTKQQVSFMQARLKPLDLKIQRAYRVNESVAIKEKLWKQRKGILLNANLPLTHNPLRI